MIQLEAKKGVDYQTIDSPVDISPEDCEDDAPRSRVGGYILAACVFGIVASLATSVFAQDTRFCEDVVSVKELDTITVFVSFSNGLSRCTLDEKPQIYTTDNGVEVGVKIAVNFLGNEDDRLIVIPPISWAAEPTEIDIPEGQVGKILVQRVLM